MTWRVTSCNPLHPFSDNDGHYRPNPNDQELMVPIKNLICLSLNQPPYRPAIGAYLYLTPSAKPRPPLFVPPANKLPVSFLRAAPAFEQLPSEATLRLYRRSEGLPDGCIKGLRVGRT